MLVQHLKINQCSFPFYKLKMKNHYFNRSRKNIWQIQQAFTIIILSKFLNLIKGVYEKPTATTILNGEELTAFPPGSETRGGCPSSPSVITVLQEIPSKCT